MGGECELALACRYRTAKPGNKIGRPEVALGVVPRAGGTQHTPRLVGIKAALGLISTGITVSAEQAEMIGLVDGVVDDPVVTAQYLDLGTIELSPKVGKLGSPEQDEAAVEQARATAAKKAANQIAQQRAIDLVALSATTTTTESMAQERDTFFELRQGDQAKALHHIFHSERGKRNLEWINEEPGGCEHIAVVGGNNMSASIAYAFLKAGFRVTLLETNADDVERALGNIEKTIDTSLKRAFISETDASGCRNRFKASFEYARTADAKLAVEAAFENKEVKKTVFALLQQHLPKNANLASNTNYLDICFSLRPLTELKSLRWRNS